MHLKKRKEKNFTKLRINYKGRDMKILGKAVLLLWQFSGEVAVTVRS